MRTNTTCTIYHLGADGYTTYAGIDAWWEDTSAAAYEKSGLNENNSACVFIPEANMPTGLVINNGEDLIIRGTTTIQINNTDTETQSATLKELKKAHNVLRIMACDNNVFASSQLNHYELLCK